MTYSDEEIEKMSYKYARTQNSYLYGYGCLSAGEQNLQKGFVDGFKACQELYEERFKDLDSEIVKLINRDFHKLLA